MKKHEESRKTSLKALFIISVLVILIIGFAIIEFWPRSNNSYEVLEFGGLRRTFYVHVPPSYDGTKPIPLVIVLHGYSGSARGIEASSRFSEKADEEGFFVVYPEGVSQRWTVGFGSLKFDVDDVGFINELINSLEQKYLIDLKRIYVTGFSNGAMMSHLLGAELSDKIAAIAPVAGSIGAVTNGLLEQIPEPDQPVSVLVIHGTSDNSVQYGGNGFLSVAESVSFWVEHNRCASVPQNETLPDGNVIVSVYGGGTNGTEVVLYTLIDVGHVWPNMPISATDVIWEFFEDHPKK
ncbi:polyhydroxybutyrate depolymerase [Candidatus Bathyarchaeota archaeon]|nr:polyhydroxybutyrate depolymerase [Candidatus Bathyarchaeota archaeon]